MMDHNRTNTQGSGQFDSFGNKRMVYSSSATTYATVKDCLKANADETETSSSTLQSLSAFAPFEKKYMCSGICESSLFFFTLDVTEGMPTSTCLVQMQKEMGAQFYPIGVACIASGAVMLLIWLFQYALWLKYDE